MPLNKQKLALLKKLMLVKKLEELKQLTIQEDKRKHRFWVNPFLEVRERHDLEAHLLKDLLWEDGADYKNFCRMSVDNFEAVLLLVEPDIKKMDTQMRYAITARNRLAISLRYIGTGDSYRSLEFLTRVSRKTISRFMPEVLGAIYDALHVSYLKTPVSQHEWLEVAQEFENIWDFPHTLGAIDGKHVRIKAPANSGSDFFNYKGFFSIVLLAVVDAHGKFIYIDVGGNGRSNDALIYKNSTLFQALKSGKLNIPNPSQLKGQDALTPYFFIGDDIFGLDTNLMKGFGNKANLSTPQEVFSYRLSRARMSVEMAFGRLVSRFRIFHRPMEVSVNKCDVVVKTCCVLHNYISASIKKPPEEHQHINFPESVARLEPQSVAQQKVSNYKFSCKIRDNLKMYCVSEGDVPYQWAKIKRN